MVSAYNDSQQQYETEKHEKTVRLVDFEIHDENQLWLT
jgi:hypothetical protein